MVARYRSRLINQRVDRVPLCVSHAGMAFAADREAVPQCVHSSSSNSSRTRIGLPRSAVAAASASAGRSRLSSCGLIGASSLQTAASKPVRKAENRLGSTRSMIMAPFHRRARDDPFGHFAIRLATLAVPPTDLGFNEKWYE